MAKKIFDEIKEHMQKKTTDELLTIWRKNDREQWSEDAFKAVEMILLGRGETLPQQEEHKEEHAEHKEEHKETSRSPEWIRKKKSTRLIAIIIFFIGIFILYLAGETSRGEDLEVILGYVILSCFIISLVFYIKSLMIKAPAATKQSAIRDSCSVDYCAYPTSLPSYFNTTTVTPNGLWKCPKCGIILKKGALGTVWDPGDSVTRVSGIATCSNCMAQYTQKDVYSGKYDVQVQAKEQGEGEVEGCVSLVVYQLSSYSPPSNARAICENLLQKKYPKERLDNFYCIGRRDSMMTPDEALVQYLEFVEQGQLPDLGTQFSKFTGTDINGKKVVVLFFRK